MSSKHKLSVSRKTSEQILNTREHLSEIISLIININPKSIEDKLLLSLETVELSNLVDIAEITDNPNFESNVYCMKTGQQVDYWDDLKIGQLIQTVGKKLAFEIIKIKSKNQVANHWLFTDGKSLEKLSNTDPVGYYVYALSRVLSAFKFDLNDKKQLKNNEDILEEYARLRIYIYKQANRIPLIILMRVNELMRRFLSITQTRSCFRHFEIPDTRMEYVTNSISDLEAFEQGLQATIGNLIRFEVMRGKLKPNLTYADVVALHLSYKGHANFRHQKKLSSMTDIEHTMYLLKEFMQDMTPTMIQIRTPEIEQPKNSWTHKGGLTLKIKSPEKQAIKLSFATVLAKRS